MKRCYEFGPDQIAALDRLAVELDTTKTGVLHAGLLLLRMAVAESRRGNALGVVNGERVLKELAGAWSAPELAKAG